MMKSKGRLKILVWSIFALLLCLVAVSGILRSTTAVRAATSGSPSTLSGTYYLFNRNSGDVLDVLDRSESTGAYIIQEFSDGTSNQQWSIVPVGNGYYKLVNNSSYKVLDVANHSTANGAYLVQWDNNSATSEQWKIVPTGKGYYKLVNRNSHKFLDVPGHSTEYGAFVIQANASSSTSQQWKFVQV